MNESDLEAIIQRVALTDFQHQAALEAGLVSPAEAKAYEAHRAEIIAKLDELRGTTDVTYAQFRTAFEQGASREILFGLRNGMHPKDPLKDAASQDLRDRFFGQKHDDDTPPAPAGA